MNEKNGFSAMVELIIIIILEMKIYIIIFCIRFMCFTIS